MAGACSFHVLDGWGDDGWHTSMHISASESVADGRKASLRITGALMSAALRLCTSHIAISITNSVVMMTYRTEYYRSKEKKKKREKENSPRKLWCCKRQRAFKQASWMTYFPHGRFPALLGSNSKQQIQPHTVPISPRLLDHRCELYRLSYSNLAGDLADCGWRGLRGYPKRVDQPDHSGYRRLGPESWPEYACATRYFLRSVCSGMLSEWRV